MENTEANSVAPPSTFTTISSLINASLSYAEDQSLSALTSSNVLKMSDGLLNMTEITGDA
jgi:hypothetical protein